MKPFECLILGSTHYRSYKTLLLEFARHRFLNGILERKNTNKKKKRTILFYCDHRLQSDVVRRNRIPVHFHLNKVSIFDASHFLVTLETRSNLFLEENSYGKTNLMTRFDFQVFECLLSNSILLESNFVVKEKTGKKERLSLDGFRSVIVDSTVTFVPVNRNQMHVS